jgi:acyl-CoA dehydrogenase
LCIDLLYKFQTQLDGLLNNFPNRLVALYLRAITMPLGRFLKPPSDRLVERVCENVLSPSPVRDRFKQYVDMGHDSSNVFNHMEAVFKKVMQTMPIQKKIHKAEKQGLISGKTFIELIDAAVKAAIVTAVEADAVRDMNDARLSITNVDDFDLKDIVFNFKEEG